MKFPDSVRQIERLLRAELSDRYESRFASHKRIMKSLDDSVLQHSLSLEFETAYPFFNKAKQKREIKKELHDSHRRAWEYALENIGPKQEYTHTDLNIIAKLIEPNQLINPACGYRAYDVRIAGATHETVEPGDIYRQVSEMIDKVNGMKSPLEKAIYSHFHIARIHPFEEGNGRTSRIVQNSILCGADLLPVCIAPFQRDLYIAILDDAVNDYDSGNPQYLYTFSEFIVQNVYMELKDYKHKMDRMAK